MPRIAMLLFLLAVLLAPAVAQSQTAPAEPPARDEPPAEAEHVVVQHILIGFRGSVRGKTVLRSREEAQELAGKILARAREGESFDELVRLYTDDQPPGIYEMANTGVAARPAEFRRAGMVKAFGDPPHCLVVGVPGESIISITIGLDDDLASDSIGELL